MDLWRTEIEACAISMQILIYSFWLFIFLFQYFHLINQSINQSIVWRSPCTPTGRILLAEDTVWAKNYPAENVRKKTRVGNVRITAFIHPDIRKNLLVNFLSTGTVASSLSMWPNSASRSHTMSVTMRKSYEPQLQSSGWNRYATTFQWIWRRCHGTYLSRTTDTNFFKLNILLILQY